jgi:hypothetical protein
MNRSMACLAVAAMVATVVPSQTRADGSDVAAGLLGGLVAGAIVGSAVAPAPPPPPVYPAPVYVAPGPYYAEPVCFGRQQVFDPYYRVYRWQRVRVPC